MAEGKRGHLQPVEDPVHLPVFRWRGRWQGKKVLTPVASDPDPITGDALSGCRPTLLPVAGSRLCLPDLQHC